MTAEPTGYPGPEYTGNTPRHPDVEVPLSGEDGNAFAIMGRTVRAMRAAGVPTADTEAFMAECNAGDYDHLLQTVMATVSTS